jgi:hypothetical protein
MVFLSAQKISAEKREYVNINAIIFGPQSIEEKRKKKKRKSLLSTAMIKKRVFDDNPSLMRNRR